MGIWSMFHAKAKDRQPANNRNKDDEGPLGKPKFNALPFSVIGAPAREVLYGAKSTGLYNFNHKVGFTTRTAAGAILTATATRQGDSLSGVLSGSQVVAGNTILVSSATSNGSVELDATRTVAKGLKATLGASLAPGPIKTPGAIAGKLGFEYGNEIIHAKGSSTLDKQPVINLTLGTGSGPLQLGADFAFSTARAATSAKEAASRAAQARAELAPSGDAPAAVAPSRATAFNTAALVGGLTRWTVAAGYRYEAHNVALAVSDSGANPAALDAKLSYACALPEGYNLAAEVVQSVPLKGGASKADSKPYVCLGLSSRLANLIKAAGQDPANLNGNGLVKLKVDTNRKLSMLYMDRFAISDEDKGRQGAPAVQVTWAAQVDMDSPFTKLPSVGITVELV